jgi:hypothetical protein
MRKGMAKTYLHVESLGEVAAAHLAIDGQLSGLDGAVHAEDLLEVRRRDIAREVRHVQARGLRLRR